MRRINRLLLVLATTLVACGKQGDPKPPVPVIPRPTTDLVVTQRGAKMILSWSYPSLSTAGKNLGEIKRINVYRTIQPLSPAVTVPASQPVVAAPQQQPASRPDAASAAKIVPLRPEQFLRLRTRIDMIDHRRLPTYTVGSRIIYEDDPPLFNADGSAERIDYGVTTDSPGGKGAMSNLPTVVPILVASPPTGLTAVPAPEGVSLAWTAPESAILAGKKAIIIGYDIYRFPPAFDASELGQPVNSAVVKETAYRDVPPLGKWKYVVTAVAVAGPPPAQSEASTPAEAEYIDLLPPPVPTNVTTLVEENAVRLLWLGVEASDLAGYKIYRTDAGGTKVLLTPQPIHETNYRDTSAALGGTYTYSVSSIDLKGNESKATSSTQVLLPR